MGSENGRKRKYEEDSSDSIPLSKRINNLTINNVANFVNHHGNGISESAVAGSSNINGVINTHHSRNHQNDAEFQPNSEMRTSSNDQILTRTESVTFTQHNSYQLDVRYDPELSEEDNPYYYTKNKLLFELHTERLKRVHH